METDSVTITANLTGTGPSSRPLVVAFFAKPPGAPREQYIGSTFVPGATPASLPWKTTGFAGDQVQIRAVVDSFNRVTETIEGDNTATANVTLKTRPDLSIAGI